MSGINQEFSILQIKLLCMHLELLTNLGREDCFFLPACHYDFIIILVNVFSCNMLMRLVHVLKVTATYY